MTSETATTTPDRCPREWGAHAHYPYKRHLIDTLLYPTIDDLANGGSPHYPHKRHLTDTLLYPTIADLANEGLTPTAHKRHLIGALLPTIDGLLE